MYTITELCDLDHTLAADYLRQFAYPYPTSCVRGVVPENSIWKNNGEIIHKEER